MKKRIIAFAIALVMVLSVVSTNPGSVNAAGSPKNVFNFSAEQVYNLRHAFDNESFDGVHQVEVKSDEWSKYLTLTSDVKITAGKRFEEGYDGKSELCYGLQFNLDWDKTPDSAKVNGEILNFQAMGAGFEKTDDIYGHYSVSITVNLVMIMFYGKDTPGYSAGSSGSTKYSSEWVDGKWYNADGKQDYEGTLSWKSNTIGWWVEDTAGWYPKNSWQKIDGTWYFFKPDGYIAADEYYNGYWFNKDGSWDDKYLLSWKNNSTGWWVEDKSGWWPSSSWLKIDGCWYYFDASGYMVTNQYVSGWWIGADGVCR